MQLELWKDFSKRNNSTKRPSETPTVLDVVLKEYTSYDHPSFIIEGVDFGYSYCRWEGQYYFIDSITALTNDLMEIVCSMDSLATNKEAIGNTRAMILYSSTGYDRQIIDGRVATKITKEIDSNSSNMGAVFEATGCYILSVANRHNSGSGFSCQYVLTGSQLEGFANTLMNPTFLEEISQFFNGAPMESIISCTWLPVNYSVAHGNHQAPLEFGGKTFNDNLYWILTDATNTISHSDTINIPWRYDDYRRNSPYTTMSLTVPMYGIIDINPSDLIGATAIHYNYVIDMSAGDVTLILRRDSATGKIISTNSFNIGVACPIAQTSSNMGGVVSGTSGVIGGLGTAAVGLLSENALVAIGGLGAAAMSASGAALSANTRTTSTRGSINGRSMKYLGFTMILSSYAMDTENPDDSNYIATHGRPVMHNGIIGNYSGYIQCDNASIELNALSEERDIINSFLNNGFYYE